MSEISPLLQLQFNMDDCELNEDTEGSHYEADDILIDLIRYLETRCELTETESNLINNILATYSTMERWFS